jgi:hypothetical protein
MQKKKITGRGGCLCCPRTEDTLPLNTRLYYGFGGYSVLKNGKHFYSGDPQGEWKSFPTLRKFENIARKIKAKWEVKLDNPLRGATWRRKEKNLWILIESNNGFA